MQQRDWQDFITLFGGLNHARAIGAFGTGEGRWVKRPLQPNDVLAHLHGAGAGIGIPPLSHDNDVPFAAIDLDEPDFEAARAMQGLLPSPTFIERSRSGNAHVWAFFASPAPAWVAMGILREATVAAGKQGVEVFPKNHDFSKVKYGNYINLPYHGDNRPILDSEGRTMPFEAFVQQALENRQDPQEWERRAHWLMLEPPREREPSTAFGEAENLHICGQYLIERAEANPVVAGHRALVFFALAKMLTNWRYCDHDEALELMRSVNEASPDPTTESELRRILANAERGRFTSTGCDDPLFLPYAHPECCIAFPRGS